MTMKKRLAFLVVVVGLLLLFYWGWQTYYQEEGELIEATGTIEATSVDLNAKMAGSIETLAIKAGDIVQKGQLIAQLSRNDLVAQWERDKLSVEKSQSALADMLSGSRKEEIKIAEANVAIAQVNLQRAQDDFTRMENLYKKGAITQLEYEKAERALAISEKQLQVAEAKLSLLQAGSREDAINTARIEVERNKAILEATEAMLEDLKIYSPLDGVVVSKNYESGEYVTPGAAIATVIDLDDLWIKVYIPTDDLPKIALGQEVSFTVSGFPKIFTGTVQEIASQGEFTPKTIQTKKERTNVVFAVKIKISSEGGILKPGMPADVVFSGGQEDD